jgi:hypothetical protein
MNSMNENELIDEKKNHFTLTIDDRDPCCDPPSEALSEALDPPETTIVSNKYTTVYNFYLDTFDSFTRERLKTFAYTIENLKNSKLARKSKLELKQLICTELTNSHLKKSISMLEIILLYELYHIIPNVHPHR